jgi:5'-methylthioadenosine phosphorylase
MVKMRFAIIGGSGFYDAGETGSETRHVTTRYGDVAVDVLHLGDEDVLFLPRHGREHTIAPHLINYRANIAALKELGVSNILASATVGAMNPNILPGKLAIPVQFLDFTHGRASTFFDEGEVKHVDVTEPYCPHLREALLNAAAARGLTLYPKATYVCTQGPRFETPAEIGMYKRMGGDLVGMTGVPEVVLAREAGICYATLALATNWAAGMADKVLSHEEWQKQRKHIATVREIFFAVIASFADEDCRCCRPFE